ncbi:hypothetical protein AYO40_01755 [Planctomycetaceae bacterium SCGC AG-212-D15]|nr:hypothetical protein AYO40_01755 [Planctomycetaceae bacterium SCGC AG-212-D15]
MTEQEWLTWTNVAQMLRFASKRSGESERKLRLWAVACVRRGWHLLQFETSREAVQLAERFADGTASDSERSAAWEAAFQMVMVNRPSPEPGRFFMADVAAERVALRSAKSWRVTAEKTAEQVIRAVQQNDPTGRAAAEERAAQASLVRDVFVFRSIRAEPSWLTWNGGAIVRAAQAAYEQRELPSGHLDSQRLAVLADMVEEAGCTDANLLTHLRNREAVHVRGCFAIDLLLGKE